MEVIKDCKDDKAIAGISRILRGMTKILKCLHKLGYGRSMFMFTGMWAVRCVVDSGHCQSIKG